MFALFGLLVAFTFSGAATRFDERRKLIVEEANAISTAYRLIDLLPTESQPELRNVFRQYVGSRIALYQTYDDAVLAREEQVRSARLQDTIWDQGLAASRSVGAAPSTALLVLPAINQMIDFTTRRALAKKGHPPTIVFALLFALGLIGAGIAGHGLAAAKPRPWAHIVGFVLATCVTVYVTLELEYPRAPGLVRIDAYDQLLVDALQGMK